MLTLTVVYISNKHPSQTFGSSELAVVCIEVSRMVILLFGICTLGVPSLITVSSSKLEVPGRETLMDKTGTTA
jgi:hypothetical protein